MEICNRKKRSLDEKAGNLWSRVFQSLEARSLKQVEISSIREFDSLEVLTNEEEEEAERQSISDLVFFL